MGNTIVPVTQEKIDKALNKLKNMKLEIEERKVLEENEDGTLSRIMLRRGTIQELGWEIEGIVEQEYYFEKSCEEGALEIDKDFFDVILCTDVVKTTVYGTYAPALSYKVGYEKIRDAYPIFLCFTKDKILATLPFSNKKIKFVGLRFKRTEKFISDCERIKTGEVQFHY